MKNLLLITLLFNSILSFATTDIEIVKITNDEDAMVTKFYATVNEHNEITNFFGKKFSQKEVVERTDFGNDISAEGIVMREKGEHKILILKGDNLHAAYGGTIIIDYLYNGLTGSRGTFEMNLEFVDGAWSLSRFETKFKHIHLHSNKKFWKTIGIKSVSIIE